VQVAALFLVGAAFLASAVEMVEALTIVLAVGVTRGWRSTLIGVASALVALAVVIAALGPLLAYIPIDGLRLGIGALLLVFGLQWLRKAIMRASGYKALHDEDSIYQKEVAEARAAGTVVKAGMDWYAYTISFKGVFLEGLEVAFIVLTFGTAQGNIPLAALGAGIAIVLVTVAGAAAHRPLSQVPENTMKFAVGAVLTTFGIFWSGEGTGVEWPGHEVAILGILATVALWSLAMVAVLKRTKDAPRLQPVSASADGSGE
jgi:uncharacterized membrane protein